ncbi:MAG: hypothetical protein ACO3PY_02630 [Pontimonas sp.]
MTKTYTRSELRDRQAKHDACISKVGQREAARYLRSKELPPQRGSIRAGLAFAILAAAALVIGLAL